jgi:hypothetical protein
MDWHGNKNKVNSGYSIRTSCKCHVEDPNDQLRQTDNAGETDQRHKSAAFVRCSIYSTRVYPVLRTTTIVKNVPVPDYAVGIGEPYHVRNAV